VALFQDTFASGNSADLKAPMRHGFKILHFRNYIKLGLPIPGKGSPEMVVQEVSPESRTGDESSGWK
jgi:hypothetical protein